LALAALGVALMHPGKNSRVAFAVGLAAAALAAVGLGLALFNVDPGIDRWLAPWAVAPGLRAVSFRIASAAMLALGLVGGALALSRFERHRFAATMLGGTASAIAVFVLLGYLEPAGQRGRKDPDGRSISPCRAVHHSCLANGKYFRV